MMPCRMPQDVRDQEGMALHKAPHGSSPWVAHRRCHVSAFKVDIGGLKNTESAMAQSQVGPHEISFGPFRLDRRCRRLMRGDVVIPLGSRAYTLLNTLLEAGGSTVAKNDLLDRVWPGQIVEENNLQVQISALRKALGNGWIVNLPGR